MSRVEKWETDRPWFYECFWEWGRRVVRGEMEWGGRVCVCVGASSAAEEEMLSSLFPQNWRKVFERVKRGSVIAPVLK